jgi:hypothetical protein
MSISGFVNATVKHAAFSAGLGVTCLAIGLAGVGFFTAAFYIFVAGHFVPLVATLITGGALVVLALLIAVVGAGILKRSKRRRPSLFSDFGGTLSLGIRLASILVRRDPKKAVILAAVSGALAEYVLSEDRK